MWVGGADLPFVLCVSCVASRRKSGPGGVMVWYLLCMKNGIECRLCTISTSGRMAVKGSEESLTDPQALIRPP